MFLITVIIFIMGIKKQSSPSPRYISLFLLLLLGLHSTPINHFVKVQTLKGGIRCSFLHNHSLMCKVIASSLLPSVSNKKWCCGQSARIVHLSFYFYSNFNIWKIPSPNKVPWQVGERRVFFQYFRGTLVRASFPNLTTWVLNNIVQPLLSTAFSNPIDNSCV